ncbi:YybH family protein [Microvirga massiliensis]|uniref:YybH family protein n=1 Tax=Microvirga massiliensis TaxID=1033741 RepID=UPI00062B3062|nr:nuclear transport factor 2 family protein [Microvirga massiliensis]
MTAPQDDLALVRRWFQRLQLHVQTVDFVGARPLFADDMITFGSFNPLTIGRTATEEEQWRTVWGRIDRFRWRLDELHTIVSEDRLTAVGIALFDSTGYTEAGAAYERPGRATIVLGRDAVGEDWVAQHMHISLFQDVPSRSFGSRPEHVSII